MAVSTPAAVGTAGAVALGPQVLTPAVKWTTEWIAMGQMPMPTDEQALSLSSVVIFVGGGVIWMLVTLVRWFFRKHHIIENGNGQVENP